MASMCYQLERQIYIHMGIVSQPSIISGAENLDKL